MTMGYLHERAPCGVAYLECSLVARLDAGVATHKVIHQDVLGMVDVGELLRHPVLAGAVGGHLADTPGDTVLPLRALHRAVGREVEPVGADLPHSLQWCGNGDVNGAVPAACFGAGNHVVSGHSAQLTQET